MAGASKPCGQVPEKLGIVFCQEKFHSAGERPADPTLIILARKQNTKALLVVVSRDCALLWRLQSRGFGYRGELNTCAVTVNERSSAMAGFIYAVSRRN